MVSLAVLTPKGGDDIFGSGAYAELAAPDAHSRTHVILCAPLAERPEGVFVERVGNPRHGPHLPAMRVSAELEVDSAPLRLLKMIGLVVEQDAEVALLVDGSFCHYLRKRQTAEVGAVVAPDDAEVAEACHTVAQQVYAGFLVEALGLWLAAVILVVAQAGIHWGLQAVELLGHILLQQRAHADVDNVAANQYEVGMFGVYHVHPPPELRLAVVVAKVKVAQQHNPNARLLVWGNALGGLYRNGFTRLVVVMRVAVAEDGEHECKDAQGGVAVAAEPSLGDEVDEPAEVEHQESHYEIEQHEDDGGAHLVDGSGKAEGHPLNGSRKHEKHA